MSYSTACTCQYCAPNSSLLRPKTTGERTQFDARLEAPSLPAHLFLHLLLLPQLVTLVPTGPTGAVLMDAHDQMLLGSQLAQAHRLLPQGLRVPLPLPLVPPLPATKALDVFLQLPGHQLRALALLLLLQQPEVLHIPAPAHAHSPASQLNTAWRPQQV